MATSRLLPRVLVIDGMKEAVGMVILQEMSGILADGTLITLGGPMTISHEHNGPDQAEIGVKIRMIGRPEIKVL